jgi:hypothetical protein
MELFLHPLIDHLRFYAFCSCWEGLGIIFIPSISNLCDLVSRSPNVNTMLGVLVMFNAIWSKHHGLICEHLHEWINLFTCCHNMIRTIRVDSKTTPSCPSYFLSSCFVSFVFIFVLCRKTELDHSITNPCGIDLALTYAKLPTVRALASITSWGCSWTHFGAAESTQQVFGAVAGDR